MEDVTPETGSEVQVDSDRQRMKKGIPREENIVNNNNYYHTFSSCNKNSSC